MLWEEYLDRLRRQVPAKLLREYGAVWEAGKAYPLVCIDAPAARTLVVTAGFHGEEPAGPLMFAQHAGEVIDYARKRDVGLRVYPCINPSGFEAGQRYNLSGEKPNNAVIEYEIEQGRWIGELPPGVPEASSRLLKQGWAKETWALVQDLIVARPPHPAPLALLDLHQDDEAPSGATYAYVFGGRIPYEHLMGTVELSGLGKALAFTQVDGRVQDSHVIITDRSGLCEYHDGTISAWAWSLGGAVYTATLETSSQSPAERAVGINRLWVKGFIDLVAATRGM
jgi:predicted deacylase